MLQVMFREWIVLNSEDDKKDIKRIVNANVSAGQGRGFVISSGENDQREVLRAHLMHHSVPYAFFDESVDGRPNLWKCLIGFLGPEGGSLTYLEGEGRPEVLETSSEPISRG